MACTDPTVPTKPPPPDLPAWSTAQHLHWASLDATGERLVVIDRPDGALDRLLAHPDVATIINDRFAPVFLHPRARPWLTERLGWPALAALAPDGCLRLAGPAPDTAPALISWLNRALQAQVQDHRYAWPPPTEVDELPADVGVWTTDDPTVAGQHFDAERGAPALVVDGRPYLYGELAPARALLSRGDERARQWLATHPTPTWPEREGPLLSCTAEDQAPLPADQHLPPVQLPGVADRPTER